MKYGFELKKEIYEKLCKGYGSEYLSKVYGINASKIRYMRRLIDKHGLEAAVALVSDRQDREAIHAWVYAEDFTVGSVL